MKIPALYFSIAVPFAFGAAVQAADVKGGTAQKADKPALKSAEEYDAEAKLRIANFKMPDGVEASLVVDSAQTQNPSAICFDHDGRLYIAEIHRWRDGVQDIRSEQRLLLDDLAIQTNADRVAMYEKDALARPLTFYTTFEDRIVVTEDTDGDGRADQSSVFADGFNDILDGPGIGLLYADGAIWYTNIPRLWKLTDTNGDGKADEKEVIQDGFGPRMSLSGHDMHGLIQGPDGKIYWSIGDRGYSITTKEGRHYHRPYEGGVFRCNPDGSDLEEVYRGLRNPQELAFDQYGNLFTCDNDADSWDTGRLVYIIEGGNSGWNHGHQAILNFRNQLELRSPNYDHPGQKNIPMNPWMTEGLWEPEFDGRPEWTLPPIDKVSWGPSGLVYNYGAVALPESYANHFWVCNFGGAKGDLETFSVENSGAGFKVAHHEVFMEGLGNTDVEFGPDGRMYLSCFNNNGWYKQDLGNVYALSNAESAGSTLVKETEALLKSDIESKTAAELDTLLSHADLRVRQRAQFALVEKGEIDLLKKAAAQTDHLLKRLHGIWGLGMTFRGSEDDALLDPLIELLSDSEMEVRAQAARVLADSRTEKAGNALVTSLDDESARVKSFAAIGVGKCGIVTALDKLYEILATNNNADVFLRHGCIQAMWYLNEREKILKQVDHESAAVRLGILLTLRQLEDPRVKYFLGDPEQSIRYEAIRAINDLDLITALPDLAEEIEKYTDAAEGIQMPENHRDQFIQTRLINANFRLGQPENASRLLAYAAQPKLPDLCREQALKAIAEWPEPTPVDPTVGIYRPLDSAQRADISEAVRTGLAPVLEQSSGKILALAIKVGLQFGADVPDDLLIKELTKAGADLDVRIESLRALGDRKSAALSDLWDKLLSDNEAELRAAAAETLLQVDPAKGLEATLALAESKNLRDLQNAYRILTPVEDEKVTALYSSNLDKLIAGKGKPGAALDLIEAAALRKEPAIQEKLAQYQESLDASDPLAAFQVTLQGGDPKAGEDIFLTHAAGQCSKCHKVGGTGAEAGPDLQGVGSRGTPDYILESLVNPSAVVVPGYGVTLITMKSGESTGGTLMSENEESITLKMPDPENAGQLIEKDISKSDIASRQPPISAMPPMGAMMNKQEIRDVVAYLKSLKK